MTEEATKDAARHGERRVLDQRLRVHDLAKSQAVAVRAGAIGRVEGEVARLEVVHGVAVLGAGKGKRVREQLSGHALRVVAVGHEVEAHAAPGELGGLLHGLGDAPEAVLAHHDAVDHHLDAVAVLLLEANLLVAELAHLAVDAHAGEALAAQILEELGVLALAIKDHRCQDQGTASLCALEDLVGHLVGGLARDGASALGAVRGADAREEQAQIVVDLGDGAHGGAGVSARGLLVDGDRRREAVDAVQVRLVHLSQELARIAGEAFHVAALALGVNGVKREARLSRAGKARDDDELVAWYVNVHVGEVVLARAADDDCVLGHVPSCLTSKCCASQCSRVGDPSREMQRVFA